MEQTPQANNPQSVTLSKISTSSKNIAITIVAVAFVAAFLASLGTYIVMSSNQKQTQMSYQPTIHPIQFLSPNPTTNEINRWVVYSDKDSQYSIEYPITWVTDKATDINRLGNNISSYTGFTVKDGKSDLVWLKVYNNPQRLSPVNFWAEYARFWTIDPEGGQEISNQQKLQQAQLVFKFMDQITVGTDSISGYKFTVSDVLPRTEIFWFVDDKAYNLGFSPQDKAYNYSKQQKKEIVDHMLRTFKAAK